jgi:hypothetical protein
MIILKNECKGIGVILKTDYSIISLKEGEHIQIDEKLVLRKPECIKVYDVKKFNELNNKKEVKKQEIAEIKKESQQKDKQEPKKTTRRTRKKTSKKGEENA